MICRQKRRIHLTVTTIFSPLYKQYRLNNLLKLVPVQKVDQVQESDATLMAICAETPGFFEIDPESVVGGAS